MRIEKIWELCETNYIRWTNHIVERLLQRNIRQADVLYALKNGEIIEQYPTDYPYPSCLVLGITLVSKFIHIVCGIDEKELWLITAYYPDSMQWSEDYKTRKEKIQ